MTEKKFSTSWKRSTQPRKQRKYRHNLPLHLKQKMLHVHLSPELRKKYEIRNILIRKGDKVRVMRGQFAKKEGVVERVNLKRERVYVNGIENIKKDGTKLLYPLNSSNLMILSFDLSDKIRKQKLENKTSESNNQKIKTESKSEIKKESPANDKAKSMDKREGKK